MIASRERVPPDLAEHLDLQVFVLRHVLLHEVRAAHRFLDGGDEVETVLTRALGEPYLLHDRPGPSDRFTQVLFCPRRGIGDADVQSPGEAAYRPPGADHSPADQSHPTDVVASSQRHVLLLEVSVAAAARRRLPDVGTPGTSGKCQAAMSHRFSWRGRADVGRGFSNARQGAQRGRARDGAPQRSPCRQMRVRSRKSGRHCG